MSVLFMTQAAVQCDVCVCFDVPRPPPPGQRHALRRDELSLLLKDAFNGSCICRRRTSDEGVLAKRACHRKRITLNKMLLGKQTAAASSV